jgi:hypothetical protein
MLVALGEEESGDDEDDVEDACGENIAQSAQQY